MKKQYLKDNHINDPHRQDTDRQTNTQARKVVCVICACRIRQPVSLLPSHQKCDEDDFL